MITKMILCWNTSINLATAVTEDEACELQQRLSSFSCLAITVGGKLAAAA